MTRRVVGYRDGRKVWSDNEPGGNARNSRGMIGGYLGGVIVVGSGSAADVEPVGSAFTGRPSPDRLAASRGVR